MATTIIDKTAVRAWLLQDGYIFHERLYILAASPLLPALINTLLGNINDNHVHNINYLAVGFHGLLTLATQTHTTPSNILLTRPWKRDTPLTAAVTFFDNMGCHCMTVKDVAVTINSSTRICSISPYELNGIDFMFGEMLYLTTSPTYQVPFAICHKILSYIIPNKNNKVQGCEGPLLSREHIHFNASIPKMTTSTTGYTATSAPSRVLLQIHRQQQPRQPHVHGSPPWRPKHPH